jgi:peptidoglycan/LPS O-acetylase OafA/YrhL
MQNFKEVVMSKSITHIPTLDGLRGLSALVVVAVHYGFVPAEADVLARVAVSVFFCLSGFLICRSLLGRKETGGGFALFFVERSARIFPVYFAVLGFAWLIGVPTAEVVNAALYRLNSVQDPTTTLSITWSLCVEEHFYITAPLVIWFLPRKIAAACFALLAAYSLYYVFSLGFFMTAASTFGAAGVTELAWLERESYYGTISNAVTLCAGVLLAYNERCLTPAVLKKTGFAIFTLSALLYLFVARHWHGNIVFLTPALDQLANATTGVILVIAALYHGQAPGWEVFSACLRDPFAVWTARISYGVYLMHQVVERVVVQVLTHEMGVAGTAGWLCTRVLSVLVTLAVAYLSYRYFERPVLDAARRVAT